MIEVIGHGGAAAYHPSNSLASFATALRLGCDRIECDLQATSDRVLVLAHDDKIKLSDGRLHRIQELPARTVCASESGIITFDALVELAGGVPLMIDIKRPGYEAEAIDAIRRHGLARASSVSSTYATTLRRIRAHFPAMQLGLSTGHWASSVSMRYGHQVMKTLLRVAVPFPLFSVLRLTGATEANLQYEIVTRPLVAALHAGGWRVNVWTVDHSTAIERAIAAGVDGVISNRPDLVDSIRLSTPTSGPAQISSDHPTALGVR